MNQNDAATLRRLVAPASELSPEWVWVRRTHVLDALDELDRQRERADAMESECDRLASELAWSQT